jgi:hypothetical protein
MNNMMLAQLMQDMQVGKQDCLFQRVVLSMDDGFGPFSCFIQDVCWIEPLFLSFRICTLCWEFGKRTLLRAPLSLLLKPWRRARSITGVLIIILEFDLSDRIASPIEPFLSLHISLVSLLTLPVSVFFIKYRILKL